ncbi:hypothetical protein BASA81_009123 [Batrachochytrium salamandrivorans]|nr:hypothetical protein BASA81_009123 [Batrachochytrium salamandrivorans]
MLLRNHTKMSPEGELLVRTFAPWLDEEDETVLEYICDMLLNTLEDDLTFVELMQTHCFPLAEQPTVWILDHVNEFQHRARNPASPPVLLEKESSQPERQQQQQQNEEALEEDDEAKREERLFMKTLSEVCGVEGEDDTLMYLCRRVVLSQDIEECARWVLDNGFDSLKAKKLEHDRIKAKQDMAQAQSEESARARVLSRFDEQECDSIKARLKTAKPIRATSAESKLRFLDNKVVSTKGEKYIEIKDKEDWDGGSRGRIKTKGKRGPGYAAG